MKCPKCQTENPHENKFCRKCGKKVLLSCPQCGEKVLGDDSFCGKCGHDLAKVEGIEEAVPETDGERKHVTVFFSDLSGYTAMSEKLDPEEVKEITSRIFGEISQVVTKYEGFIEKFVGDAVMALFGVPKAHEDDPVRAIMAAREIHDLVKTISPEIGKKIGQPLSMHTGINTGLVVTSDVEMEKGTHGVAGDTINVASRLSGLAKFGEILVGFDTYRQSEGYFDFAELEPAKVKGKTEPVRVYKVLSAKKKPLTMRRLSGLRAELIGRKVEMAQLREAFEKLQEGKGSIFSICGDAGTGKSRLVAEFKATLDPEKFQWLEGHAYAYSQNIPYFPLIDFLNRILQIEEGDPPEKVRERVESGIESLIGKKEDIVPYVGSLYSLSYPEVEEVSPEFWKSQLQNAIQTILSAVAQRAPTIFFLEDLHWTDSAFLELLRKSLLEIRHPAIVLCVYRPVISLFTSHLLGSISKIHHEIRLQDLSPSEAQDMVESLLKTETIPSELKQFVQKKLEGNPFYLEEVINSLIESETLIRDNGSWKLTRQISELDISSTIHGVISARLDRLEKETKRILQEASVIGRAFLYDILRRITELKDQCDWCLSGLERLDLIRTRSLQPELEYVFKHALTQEVVYNGLLKKERKEIHERIGLVMEQLFRDRLSEFYETLAFHFKHGQSVHKAVDYLMKSGEKSLKRYAVEESHQYYEEAYNLLLDKREKTREEEELLIDLLIKWAYVFYYRGDFKGLTDVLTAHADIAESLDDKARVGMFYVWMGLMLWEREKFRESYQYLHEALELGEEIDNKRIIGYACTLLCFAYKELGLLGDEGIDFGKRGQEIAESLESDHFLYFKSLYGMAEFYLARGESKKLCEVAKRLLVYGQKHNNVRSLSVSHIHMGNSHFIAGDFPSSIKCYQRAIETSVDPFYSQIPILMTGISYTLIGQFKEAEAPLKEALSYSQNFGCDILKTPAQLAFGTVLLSKGYFKQGINMIEDVRQSCLQNERRWFYAFSEYVLGKVYLQILERAGPMDLSTMAKNIGFLTKNVPFAGRKAEAHFREAIEVGEKIGAKSVAGPAYLDLGFLHIAKKRRDQAIECISKAIQIFEQCDAEGYLKKAKEALASLE